MLDAQVEVRLGTLDLVVPLQVAEREVVALLGPNGSGKSTALRAIAGLQPLDGGRLVLDDRVLDDPATGTFVAPESRTIGFVVQDHLLFPRMDVLDNVAFGLRAAGARRRDARASARAVLERLGSADLAGARPHELSGGQSQKVALARAIATRPRLLLLDEPLAALDASARASVRTELRRDLVEVGGPRLLVTHDPVDAAVLADRVVVIEAGHVVQTGTVEEVALRPASPFVADLMGVNLVHGRAVDTHTIELSSGGRLTLADPLPGHDVSVAIRPQAIALHAHRPDGSPRNTWSATVADVESTAERARVRLDGPIPVTAEITPAAVADLGLAPGSDVWASVKAVDLTAYAR
jgi:molybdate transport system ATP-binding protein